MQNTEYWTHCLARICGVDVAVFAAVVVVVHVDLAVPLITYTIVAAAFADAVDAAVVVHVADSLRMLSTKSLPFWFGKCEDTAVLGRQV